MGWSLSSNIESLIIVFCDGTLLGRQRESDCGENIRSQLNNLIVARWLIRLTPRLLTSSLLPAVSSLTWPGAVSWSQSRVALAPCFLLVLLFSYQAAHLKPSLAQCKYIPHNLGAWLGVTMEPRLWAAISSWLVKIQYFPVYRAARIALTALWQKNIF